jgi:hypothetical protein
MQLVTFCIVERLYGSLGIAVKKGKVWECWAGFARLTLPFFFLTTAIPAEPDLPLLAVLIVML